jgi:hypothetical protein
MRCAIGSLYVRLLFLSKIHAPINLVSFDDKILLANRFLDGRDMAKVLRHYEELTGMDNWYD